MGSDQVIGGAKTERLGRTLLHLCARASAPRQVFRRGAFNRTPSGDAARLYHNHNFGRGAKSSPALFNTNSTTRPVPPPTFTRRQLRAHPCAQPDESTCFSAGISAITGHLDPGPERGVAAFTTGRGGATAHPTQKASVAPARAKRSVERILNSPNWPISLTGSDLAHGKAFGFRGWSQAGRLIPR